MKGVVWAVLLLFLLVETTTTTTTTATSTRQALLKTRGRGRGGEGKKEVATFAGGCFWCMQPPFHEVEGVINTEVGFTGGWIPNPSYEQVSVGETGHLEAVNIVYDPSKITYMSLLSIYWRNIDPLDKHGQFCDRGDSYVSAIFPHSPQQRKDALATREYVGILLKDDSVKTKISNGGRFWRAEEYHQNYWLKNSTRYHYYRNLCGRDKRLKELWGGFLPEASLFPRKGFSIE